MPPMTRRAAAGILIEQEVNERVMIADRRVGPVRRSSHPRILYTG